MSDVVFFCLKVPVNLSKLTVLSSNIRNVYYKKYKNTHTINNKFNIIFNYPKQLLTYENKKNIKKNRKHYNKKKN